MENPAVLNIRISQELKQSLEQQAQQRNQTISDYVRDLLSKPVLQGDDYISGIPPELLEKITAEAQRRKQSEVNVIAKAMRFALDQLFISPNWVRW